MGRKKKIVVQPEILDPTFEQVAARAYEYYLARGEEHGHDLDDWLRAEADLRAELGKEASA